MPEEWMIALAVVVGVVAGLGLSRGFRRREEAVAFANAREERLTRKLARQLGGPLGPALDAVRKELEIAPTQTDETILKRAEYHYRQNLPDPGPCRVYRDRAPG
jgi:hypothetical protein